MRGSLLSVLAALHFAVLRHVEQRTKSQAKGSKTVRKLPAAALSELTRAACARFAKPVAFANGKREKTSNTLLRAIEMGDAAYAFTTS